ncbi:MAG: carbohydrate binding family 9 domain-containing protein [Gemmatimonadetes bacterium]|nr:carbohydrate binding family 9 domain-containing protein [Gemmatimonadota bacterium]
MRRLLLAFAMVFLAFASPLPGQVGNSAANAAPRRYVLSAVRISGAAPIVDGRLDEPVWPTAPVATDFIQQTPNPGQPATVRTEARVLYDEAAIYVGMRMYDPAPDSIAATLARRDFSGYSDFAQVVLDSYHDRRTAFRFGVNPAGVKKDVFHSEDFNEDTGWDAVWDARTEIDSLGWTAEFRIPLSQLRYASGGAQVWGINFQRQVARTNERSFWAPILPDVGGFVSKFGDLEGLVDLPAVRRIEVLPYSVGRLERAPGDEADPFYHRTDLFGSAGADLKVGLTSNLTLTATLNPDFGQVEADPSVVNLTAFETFFPERRPFFVEGNNIFRFDIRYPYFVRGTHFRNDGPFYTRRIGRAPQAGLPADAVYADVPAAANILAAAKLSGKTAGGWSIGVMDALTGRERAPFRDTAGARRSVEIEPLTNYGVARAIRDFRRGQSAIGAIFSATNRSLDDPRLAFLRSAAYVGGLDTRHRLGGGNRELAASFAATHIRGSAAAIQRVQLGPGHYFQRPDAPHLDYDSTATSLTGWASSLRYEKFGGGHWRYGLYGHARSPKFEMNDLGFQRTTDWALQGGWLGYHVNRPGSWYRQWNLNLNNWAGVSFGGERQALGFNSNGFIQLKNFWGAYFGVDHELPAYSPSELRGGPSLYLPTWTNYQMGFFTDSRRPVSFEFFHDMQREYQSGSWAYEMFPAVAVRPSLRMDLEVGPGIAWNRNRTQFVTVKSAADGPHYVFGRIDQTTTLLTVRLNYTFTPDLSLQLYAQPFISAGRYGEFKEVTDARGRGYDDRFYTYSGSEIAFNDSTGRYEVDRDGNATPEFSFGRPDFNVTEMRSNVVLRWEYRPGSTVFVVWSSGRGDFSPDGRLQFSRDVRRVFEAPATNVFLVKVNYWLSL